MATIRAHRKRKHAPSLDKSERSKRQPNPGRAIETSQRHLTTTTAVKPKSKKQIHTRTRKKSPEDEKKYLKRAKTNPLRTYSYIKRARNISLRRNKQEKPRRGKKALGVKLRVERWTNIHIKITTWEACLPQLSQGQPPLFCGCSIHHPSDISHNTRLPTLRKDTTQRHQQPTALVYSENG